MVRMRRYPIWMDRKIVNRSNAVKKYKHLLKETIISSLERETCYRMEIIVLKNINDNLKKRLDNNEDITALINFECNKDVPEEFILAGVKEAFLKNLSKYLIINEVGFIGNNTRVIKINPHDESIRREYYVKINADAYHKAAKDNPCYELNNKEPLMNEISYREAIPYTVKTTVLEDNTEFKEYFCSTCGYQFSNKDVFDEINYCPNCGQKQDWGGQNDSKRNV